MENVDIKEPSIHAAKKGELIEFAQRYNNYTGTEKNQSLLDVQGVIAQVVQEAGGIRFK